MSIVSSRMDTAYTAAISLRIDRIQPIGAFAMIQTLLRARLFG
jgi:hypothetical protein